MTPTRAQEVSGSDPSPDVVEGQVKRVTYEDEATGFRVLRVIARNGGQVTVVGRMLRVVVGAEIRATGRWETDVRHGRQLHASSVIVMEPATLKGLARMLGSGLVPGIGPTFASRVVEQFGTQTTEVLDKYPERLNEVPGLGPKRAEVLARVWGEQRAARESMMFLQGHGISLALGQRIVRRYGAETVRLIEQNPYRLAADIWGIGFKKADEIARAIGIAPDAPERIKAAILHVLDQACDKGHVFVPQVSLLIETEKFVQVDHRQIESAMDEICDCKQAHRQELGDFGTVLYAGRMYAAEVGLADSLGRLCDRRVRCLAGAEEAIDSFEKRTGASLAPAQRDAVQQAAARGVLVVTGGPGVGKTTIVRALLELFDRAGLGVGLAAPTGRASRRMEEATGHEAQTIHRLLEFDPRKGGFERNETRPLELDALVVDECSMLDVQLAYSLVRALPSHARLVLVGDVDQLPSIGPGAVLRDVIESERVPCVRLVEIFRQAAQSRIVGNAHRILRGYMPESSPKGDRKGDFFVVHAKTGELVADLIRQLVVDRIPKTFGLDPVRQVQVLTPMHRGPGGSEVLNRVLQQALNPSGVATTPERGGTTLRAGDKVMQLRNDYGRDVFNGDIGFVCASEAESRQLVVELEGRRVTYEESQLDELTLSYACSIHKSQGSEYPAVVIPMLTSHYVMLSRNLLYTAVTRGKKLVVLVTDGDAVRIALDQARKEERFTWLAQRLRGWAQ